MSLDELRALAEQEDTEQEVVAEEEVEQEAEPSETETEQTEEESEEFELVLEDEPAPQEQRYTPEQAILHKLKKTKAKAKESAAENEELKQQVEALTRTVESLKAPEQAPQVQARKFPDLYDPGIDGDRDKYNVAVHTYMDETQRLQREQAEQASQQAAAQNQLHEQQVALANKVATFATENKISSDKAAEAVSVAISEIDQAYGAEGALQYLLSNLEGDVAKVTYLLGTNAKARNDVIKALTEDRTGMKAGMLLAKFEVKAEQKRKISGAPEPDQAIKGDALDGVVDSTLQKQFDEETDYMKLKEIMRQAKERGVMLKT